MENKVHQKKPQGIQKKKDSKDHQKPIIQKNTTKDKR